MTKMQKITLTSIFILTFLLILVLVLVINLHYFKSDNNTSSKTQESLSKSNLSSSITKKSTQNSKINSIEQSSNVSTAIKSSLSIPSNVSSFPSQSTSLNIDAYTDQIVASTQSSKVLSLDSTTLNSTYSNLKPIMKTSDNVDLSKYLYLYQNGQVKLISKSIELIDTVRDNSTDIYIISKFNYPHQNTLAIANTDFSKVIDLPFSTDYYPNDDKGSLLKSMYISKIEPTSKVVNITWTINDGRDVKLNQYSIPNQFLSKLLQ